jgi:hypothetical protein
MNALTATPDTAAGLAVQLMRCGDRFVTTCGRIRTAR